MKPATAYLGAGGVQKRSYHTIKWINDNIGGGNVSYQSAGMCSQELGCDES
jgi:hypothetical protein